MMSCMYFKHAVWVYDGLSCKQCCSMFLSYLISIWTTPNHYQPLIGTKLPWFLTTFMLCSVMSCVQTCDLIGSLLRTHIGDEPDSFVRIYVDDSLQQLWRHDANAQVDSFGYSSQQLERTNMNKNSWTCRSAAALTVHIQSQCMCCICDIIDNHPVLAAACYADAGRTLPAGKQGNVRSTIFLGLHMFLKIGNHREAPQKIDLFLWMLDIGWFTLTIWIYGLTG